MNIRDTRYSILEDFEPEQNTEIDVYRDFIGRDKTEEIKRLAEPLQDTSWTNINSTFMGGGVAEMLRGLIPLARGLGIQAGWSVIRGTNDFFQVTKKFHNMLQGVGNEITLDEIFGAYLDTIDENTRNTLIASDLVVIHDPQPAALVMNGIIFGNILWRCHIDTSNANQTVWRFLLPYINHCSGAIFTMPEFVGGGLQIPIYEMNPCIDPCATKNHNYERVEALDILSPLLQQHNVDPQRPILTAISRYDIHKNQESVIRAFLLLREEKKFNPPPCLILMGNTATDDPEGGAMLDHLRRVAGDDPDIHFLVNVPDNDRVVGALMTIARAMIHPATREGFGLVVTEALWQGTPVIGSPVGGIKKQVLEGETGYLVAPLDIPAIAGAMARVLENPAEAKEMGSRGTEHVRHNFLLPELMRRYLILMRFYTGKEKAFPEFRLDQLSYSEIMANIRAYSRQAFLPPKKNHPE